MLPIVLLAPLRYYVAIGQEIVHRCQAGRPFVTDPGDLHLRRLTGEDQQPVVARVSSQIEKDVDPVRSDLLRQPLVARTRHVAPLGGNRLEATRQVIVAEPVGVAKGLELRLVQVL